MDQPISVEIDLKSPLAPKAQYRIRPHVFVCGRDDCVVLMDLKRLKYFAVDWRRSEALMELVDGWPTPNLNVLRLHERASPHRALTSTDSFIEFLAQQGWITDELHNGKSAVPVVPKIPVETFPIFSLERATRSYVRYLPQFLLAHRRATWLRKHWGISKIIERIQLRKHTTRVGEVPVDELKLLVKAHHHLRPLLYSSLDACLDDSLVLLEFLASNKIYADWVFGIRTRPWVPHCWVQAGTTLCNDSVANVRRFSVLAVF